MKGCCKRRRCHDGWDRKRIGSLCKAATKTVLPMKLFRPRVAAAVVTGPKKIGSLSEAVTKTVLLMKATRLDLLENR